MRISGVFANYSKNNKVNFGRFADDNAREVVKKALATDDKVMKPVYNSWFKRIEECDFFEAYTDEEDNNTVKGRFTDEFVSSNADNKQISRQITRKVDFLKRHGVLNDLSTFDNAETMAMEIWDFEELRKGIDVADKRVKLMMEMANKSKKPENYAARRAEEEAYR